jgi:phosphohistidine phosphatase SixA
MGNDRLERQLDARGARLACALGASLKSLAIKVSPVYCSPAFRAHEALKLAGLEQIISAPELDEEPDSIRHTRWLRAQSSRSPPIGSNTLLMTHLPNLLEAFDGLGSVEVGEMLVYMTAQTDTGLLIARVRIEEWPRLSQRMGGAPA